MLDSFVRYVDPVTTAIVVGLVVYWVRRRFKA